MNKFVLFVYDRFRRHPILATSFCILLTVCMLLAMLSLHYKEDISDFLPLDGDNKTAMSIYQDISGANNIYAIISTRDSVTLDPDLLTRGVDAFISHVEENDTAGYISGMVSGIDMEKMEEVSGFIYENIPLFLTEADYARIDTLLSSTGFIEQKIAEDKQMLLFPSSAMIAENISRDPLGLFSQVPGRLGRNGMDFNFDTYNGYILSPDSRRAIIVMKSAFGAQESENNSHLATLLENASRQVSEEIPALKVSLIGGPTIAVANADRIKKDSILAISIAGILILSLLIYVFRSARNILLIFVSVGWGWLFAMAVISLFYHSISIIVIGIASVMLGIAVNYPLHLIDHLKDSHNRREALKEIVAPLLVGNITTIGAFLALVPLNATALHDLGLFSALLLAGTIIFVLFFLPHIVKIPLPGAKPIPEPRFISRISGISLENHPAIVIAVLCLTVVFAYFSFDTEFDTDMRHINYMTPAQRENMEYFQTIAENKRNTEHLYVASSAPTWEEALRNNEKIEETINKLCGTGKAIPKDQASLFIVSEEKQKERLAHWKSFIARHKEAITTEINKSAGANGFSEGAFTPFREILEADYSEHDFKYFAPLTESIFASDISQRPERKSFVRILEVDRDKIIDVKSAIDDSDFSGLCFDVTSMNGSIANTLSDDFNYIGLACGCIVFLFLWISLGRIELAIISFLPMAFSWIWILGIMGILGLKFNIVNVILATFIFGQGDDYTIFITEGLSYEYAYRRKLLNSYKNSIIVSALIMFIGIGCLLFAQHPAMRSLGEVTVVGMFSVVLMAYLFPPLIFKFLVYHKKQLRARPLTLSSILHRIYFTLFTFIQISELYILHLWWHITNRKRHKAYLTKALRKGIESNFQKFSHHIIITANEKEVLPATAVLLSMNVFSIYVMACFMLKYTDPAFLLKDVERLPGYARRIIGWCGMPVIPDEEYRIQNGTMTNGRRILSGVAILSRPYQNADLAYIDEGVVLIEFKTESFSDKTYSYKWIDEIKESIFSADKSLYSYFLKNTAEIVAERFLYKGAGIYQSVRRSLRKYLIETGNNPDLRGEPEMKSLSLGQCYGFGERELLIALLNPNLRFSCIMEDSDRRRMLEVAAEGLVNNLSIKASGES